MASPRDHLSDLRRYYLPQAWTKAGNAWHRAAGNRLHGARQGYRNWLNRRAHERGKSPLPERLARPVHSLPIQRDRINPATGRPRRDDRPLGRVKDQSLARRAPQRQRGRRSR